MPVAGGGFEQCYNAQAVVAADSLLVIAAQVVQAPNDKQQIEPMLEQIGALPEELGKPETLLADTGYFSAANVAACAAAQIDPMIAQGRQSHYPPLSERFAKYRRRRRTRRRSKPWATVCRRRRQEALCLAQADPGAGVRDHQIGDGLPPVPAAWARKCPR